MIRIETDGLLSVIADLDGLQKKLSNQNIADLNEKRAENFKKHLVNWVKTDQLGLSPISSATEMISGPHHPMSDTNEMIDSVEVKAQSEYAEVGFFKNGEAGKLHTKLAGAKSEHRLRIYEIVQMHHVRSGFRIPKGNTGISKEMREFFAANRIYLSESKKFIYVKTRPFLWKALSKYFLERRDDKIINEFVKGL